MTKTHISCVTKAHAFEDQLVAYVVLSPWKNIVTISYITVIVPILQLSPLYISNNTVLSIVWGGSPHGPSWCSADVMDTVDCF